MVVLGRAEDYVSPRTGAHNRRWECLCDCGQTTTVGAPQIPAQKSCSRSCPAAIAAFRAANPVSASKNRARRVAHQTLSAVDRDAIWRRDAGICHLCLLPADAADWHLDHVIPIVHGGPHDPRNGAVSHPSCNLRKNDRISHASHLAPGAWQAYDELHNVSGTLSQ